MITALVFDLGGVILPMRAHAMRHIVASVFGVSTENARDIWHRHKDAVLTGELPSPEFVQKVRIETGSAETAADLLEKWKTVFMQETKDVNDELLSLIGKLRKRYRAYLLTDTLDVHHAHNSTRGIYERFDGVYASHLEGKSKSRGEEAFRHFLAKFGLRAEECVFTDDLEPYVRVAETVGMHGILYVSNADFLKRLTDILGNA